MTGEWFRYNPLYTIETFPQGNSPDNETLAFYASHNRLLRENYPKYKDYWTDHIENSKRAMLESAQGLSGDALILGLGNGMDTPLEELTRQFDRVTIVDIDEEAARLAVGKLPQEAQLKTHLRIDDITGAIKGATERLGQIIQTTSSERAFITEVSAAIPTLSSQPLNLSQRFDFVSSSLILTQLASLLVEHMNIQTKQKFGTALPSILLPDDPYHQTLSRLATRLQNEHIQFLAKHTKEEGRAYFSDTVTRQFILRDPLTQQIYTPSKPLPLVDGPNLYEEIETYFTLDNEKDWAWYRRPPPRASFGPSSGDAFTVLAYTLMPKKI